MTGRRVTMIAHLTAAGPVLFGPQWQSEMARALGVSDRSVRRWLAENSAPDEIAPQLRKLIDTRISRLKQVRRRLSD
jgi:hypothetical protein